MTSHSHGLVEALQQQKRGGRIKPPVLAQNLHSWWNDASCKRPPRVCKMSTHDIVKTELYVELNTINQVEIYPPLLTCRDKYRRF